MVFEFEGKQLKLLKVDYGAKRAKLQDYMDGKVYNIPMNRLGRYWLFMSDSIEMLVNERILGVFNDENQAMIKMREAAEFINYRNDTFWRFLKLSEKMTSIDFGSWSKFGILMDLGESKEE